MVDITSALARKEVPEKPTRDASLLYTPLYFEHRRCGLLSCRKLAEDTESGVLFRCSGGYEGLEQYCCREHQLEHWTRRFARDCAENEQYHSNTAIYFVQCNGFACIVQSRERGCVLPSLHLHIKY